jgi:topoisomerase-4 subunit A
MGNRLSTHEVKQVSLLVSEEPEPIIAASPILEVVDVEESVADLEENPMPSSTEPEPEEVKEIPTPQSEKATSAADVHEEAPEPIKPAKEIGFEITNPDEVDIDDKGQLGLF